MGLFHKTKKMFIDETEQSTVMTSGLGSSALTGISTFKNRPKPDNAVLNEQFPMGKMIDSSRISVICDRFVRIGLTEFSKNHFDVNALKELSYDELCYIYGTIGNYVQMTATGMTETAVFYKSFLREKIVAMLSTIPVYTIYTNTAYMPFAMSDSSLYLFTDRDLALKTIQNYGYDCLTIFEITPDTFQSLFETYYCTYYKLINLNGQKKINIEEIFTTRPIREYGNICLESCGRMIDYKQQLGIYHSIAKTENRKLTDEEEFKLNQMSYGVSVSLLKNSLLLPAKTENEKIRGFWVPNSVLEDGRKFFSLFTDQFAINQYYNEPIASVALPNLIIDQYKACKNDPAISGIMINPGREEYIMTKDMLCQLFPDV